MLLHTINMKPNIWGSICAWRIKAYEIGNNMIQLNPRYEVIYIPENNDQDCDRIADV